jgi:hypothetical protein
MRCTSRHALRIAAALAALVAGAVAGPPPAEARLAHSKFSELLRDSELICRGRVDRTGEERLLFLRRKDGRWTGTHYGRSYWWLVPAADEATGPVTPLKYPITMLRFHGEHRRLLRPARLGPGVDPTRPASHGDARITKMIALSDLEKAIASQRALHRQGSGQTAGQGAADRGE